MDPRRLALALLVSLALASGATYVIYSRLRKQAATTAPTVTKKIVGAQHNLEAGLPLKDEDLTLIDWPVSLVPLTSFAKKDELLGRALINPVAEKMPILQPDLALPNSGIALSTKIPPGMRAVSVPSNEIVGVAGFLFPHSRVDVLATWTDPQTKVSTTETVLQDVEVLATGQVVQPDPQGKPQTVTVVTLLMSPEDSEKLTLVRTNSGMQFVLRNGADQLQTKVVPVNWKQVSSAEEVKAAAAAPRRKKPQPKVQAAAAPPAPPVYLIEVIRGEKRSVETIQLQETPR